ncbi:hypothetical protein H4Q32_005876 [Labeo rohita]|uniref:Uncharacterized protein n=1 Tax=Labeo rohita TaxID=84645 RepID=A0ABQ8LPN4_LABRO|nr:hypothetical protein H4Q32_005876 [Labeo rohita]
MASHCPSSPGLQLNSSSLLQSQQEALYAASPNLREVNFLSLPAIPRAVNVFQTDCSGKPLQLQLLWLVPFLSCSRSVSEPEVPDHMTTSGHRMFGLTGESVVFYPGSTLISHDCAACRRLFLHSRLGSSRIHILSNHPEHLHLRRDQSNHKTLILYQ